MKDLEGCSAVDAPLEREKRLRECVTSIVPCDIKKEDPLLGVTGGGTESLFDIISCSLTIVTTSENLEEYKKILRSCCVF